jgi:hypothetical protein
MTSSTKTISFTPTYGVTELRFWLLDKAGNVSTETIRVLKIMSPRVQHAWLFNDGSGTAATDVARPSSRMMDLAVGSGTWASGYRADTISNDPDDTALHFDGTGDGTTTTGPAVFTQDSFTATARVKLDQMEGGTFVAVSQDGVQNSAFKLGYNTTLGSWAAWFHPTDTAGGGWVRLDSGLAPIDEGNEELPPFPDGKPDWQHLALVHDAAAEEVRLLVDGNIAATMSTTDILDWDSSGSLRIGRGQTDGSSMGTGSGKVDDVFVFDSALTEAQIRRVAFSVEDELQVEPIRDEILIAGRAAAWPLDDGQGQSAVDSTGSGHDMSLGADTRWVPGRHAANNPSDRAVSFPGTDDGYGVTADPVLDTTESYSVSAWVQVPASVSQGAVLSQFGDNSSGTLLTFSPTNDAWRFGKHKSDQVEDAGWNVVHSAGPPVRDQWTHLVGVYDAEAGRFRLYVDGLMQDAVESTPAWAAGGAFNIGRYLYKGNPSLRWNGVIDDVRVYQRVLSPAEIAYLGREELS